MSHTNFLGIPIDGKIQRSEGRAAQRPRSELEPLIRALVEDDTIVEFGWQQFTPYFNDGEPCVFNAYGLWVRTISDSKNEDEDEDEDEDLSVEFAHHPSLGRIEWEYIGQWPDRERRIKTYEGPDLHRLERCIALDDAIQSGAFDDVLLDAFGDHADITIRRDGITIDFYSHD